MSKHTISVVKDFSDQPFGRYKSDGDRSAEVFREQHLVPALEAHDRVVVDLSGYNYYGSSFLEEAFGGLVRSGEYTPDDLERRLEVVHELLPSITREVKGYIQEAERWA